MPIAKAVLPQTQFEPARRRTNYLNLLVSTSASEVLWYTHPNFRVPPLVDAWFANRLTRGLVRFTVAVPTQSAPGAPKIVFSQD